MPFSKLAFIKFWSKKILESSVYDIENIENVSVKNNYKLIYFNEAAHLEKRFDRPMWQK